MSEFIAQLHLDRCPVEKLGGSGAVLPRSAETQGERAQCGAVGRRSRDST